MGHQMVRPMHEKSTGRIVQQNRQDFVARLLFFPDLFFLMVSPTFVLVISSSLAISVVNMLPNERLSFICNLVHL
jgi:hypothetical protein